MKNKIILIFFVLISSFLSMSLVNALDISIENYYPTPVEAGGYFTVWIRVMNNEDNIVENTGIRFKESYPFSLDPTEQKEITINKLEAKSSITKQFKIRVDKEAKEGGNDIAFEYKACAGCVWEEKSMSITVVEFQTMFDTVLQEITTEGTFIAIANIGKNPANGITISIPEQEYFKTDLISASIVGNLESGDYTIVAFKILPKQKGIDEQKELVVQIDYTDPFGVRRTTIKKVLLNPSSLSRISASGTGLQTRTGAQTTSIFSSLLTNMWFWVSLILGIILLIKPIKRLYRRLRLKF